MPRIDGFSRRIDARGCIELCVVVTIPFFREISPFPRLGFEIGTDLTEGCIMNCGDE